MPDDTQKDFRDQLFKGLKELAETAFPKTCANCGRAYPTAEQFLLETEPVRATHTGLKEAIGEDGLSCVEVFRNCACGSTLMDIFGNRRDLSDASAERRNRFDALMELLVLNGLEPDTARNELLKLMRGEHSAAIAELHPPQKHT